MKEAKNAGADAVKTQKEITKLCIQKPSSIKFMIILTVLVCHMENIEKN